MRKDAVKRLGIPFIAFHPFMEMVAEKRSDMKSKATCRMYDKNGGHAFFPLQIYQIWTLDPNPFFKK